MSFMWLLYEFYIVFAYIIIYYLHWLIATLNWICHCHQQVVSIHQNIAILYEIIPPDVVSVSVSFLFDILLKFNLSLSLVLLIDIRHEIFKRLWNLKCPICNLHHISYLTHQKTWSYLNFLKNLFYLNDLCI